MGLAQLRAISNRQPNVFVYGMPLEGHPWSPPQAEDYEALMSRIKGEIHHTNLLSAWVGDFQVEMQALLLGELFANKVDRRDPPDPDQFCIRLDRYDEIQRRLASTEWGKRAVEMEAEAWARFSNKARRSGGEGD